MLGASSMPDSSTAERAPDSMDVPTLPKPQLDELVDEAEEDRVFEALLQRSAEPRQIGRYVVLDSLGQGGVVLRAYDRELDRPVALKGFSFYDGGRPLIMVRERSAPSRGRMTVAHELAHLVMHRGVANSTEDIEQQAYRFAGAFMVPRFAFLREFPRPGTYFDWRALVDFKQRWGLSIQGSLKRAHDLGIISAIQLRTGYVEISRRKWRVDEPGETMEPERPHLLQDALKVCTSLGRKVSGMLRSNPMPLESVAELTGLDLPPEQDEAANVPNVVPLFRKPQ